MNQYKVYVRLEFKATVIVNADDGVEAAEIVEKEWGAVLDNPHTSNDEKVIDWDAEMHPNKEITVIKCIKQNIDDDGSPESHPDEDDL